MKKKHLIAKKTLSVFLAVLMLMSAWVFVPGEHNHAEAATATNTATAIYNTELLNKLTTATAPDTTTSYAYGRFNVYSNGDTDSAYNANKADSYVNVLYSPQVTNASDLGVAFTGIDKVEGYSGVYYPDTILRYDGKYDDVSKMPRMGVLLSVDFAKSKTQGKIANCWISSANGGLQFYSKVSGNKWKGEAKDDSCFYYTYYTSGSSASVNTDGTSTSTYNESDKSWGSYVGKWTFFANHLVFNDTMGEHEWLRTIKPKWKFMGGSGTTTSSEFTSSKTIYVMNFKAYKDFITTTIHNKVTELKADADMYTPASINNFVNAAQAFINLNPKNYCSSPANASKWATDINNAKTAYETAVSGLKKRTVDITYENIFSFSDWANSKAVDFNATDIKVDENKGTIDITATASVDEKVTPTMMAADLDKGYYTMPANSQTTYAIDFTTSGGVGGSEIFFFWYNASGKLISYESRHGSGSGRNKGLTITSPEGAVGATIRFDNNNQYQDCTITFSNIAVYPVSREDSYGISNWPVRHYRKAYTYNDTSDALANLDKPTRDGYAFVKWENVNGTDYVAEAMTGNKVLNARWEQLVYDIGYDNLFSLSDWSRTNSSKSSNSSRGEVKFDVTNGTITVNTSKDGEVYTTYGSGSDQYLIPVEGNTEYIFEADMDLIKGPSEKARGQMFVFFYDANGNGISGAIYNGSAQSSPHIGIYPNTNGTHSIAFKTPSNCAKMSLRVGATEAGDKATYSNIGFYKKADYDAYAKNYAEIRVPFKVGETINLALRPKREGYEFAGWVDSQRNPVTSVEGFSASDTVYATWTALYKVVFKDEDGNPLATEYVAPGGAVEKVPDVPTKRSDDNYEYTVSEVNGGWSADITNVISDLEVRPVYTHKEHPKEMIEYIIETPADCEKNGTIVKTCNNCSYEWNGGDPYYDALGEKAPALGHNYVTVITGTSSGETDTDTHIVECNRKGCKYGEDGKAARTTVVHSFGLDETQGSEATCTIPGKTYYKCACLQEKVVIGETNSNNHVNTEIVGKVDPTCTEDGYTGDEVCTACDAVITKGTVDPANGHTWTETTKYLKSAADCENDAVYYQECSQCGISAENDTTGTGTTWTDTGSAEGHTWTKVKDNKYLATSADCEKDATYYYVCSRCDVSSKDKDGSTWTDEGSASGHNFTGDYVNHKNGTHSQKCTNSNCDAISEPVSCTYGAWETTAATHKHTCIYCKYTTVAEDHIWGGWSEADGNNDDAVGNQKHTCTVCQRVETVECTNYTSVKTEATCEKDAFTTYTCNECGHGYTVIHEGTKTGHNFTEDYKFDAENDKHQQLCANGCGSYGVGTEKDAWADCVWTYKNKKDGKHIASCVCGNSEEQDCSGGTATCTAPAKCKFCNTNYGTTSAHSFTGAAVKLDGDFHARLCVYCGDTTGFYGIGTTKDDTEPCTGGEATCMKEATCTVCGDKHGDIDADAHKWITPPVADKNADGTHTHTYTCAYNEAHKKTEECFPGIAGVVPPTCNEAGYTVLECQDCADRWNTDPVDALGHDWGEWVSDEVVEGQPHTHTRRCLRECEYDDNYQTVECTKEEASKVVTKPTCTTDGYTTYTCNFCDYVWVDDEVEALGHNYTQKIRDTEHLKEAANCEHANIYYFDCSRCDRSAEDIVDGEKYTGEVTYTEGKVRAHDWQNKVDEKYLASVATCFASAKYFKSCGYEDCAKSSEEVNGTGKGVKFSYGSPLEHDWKEIKAEKYLATDADCITDATYYYECSLCKSSSEDEGDGITWIDIDSKSGHDFEHEDGHKAAADATCTADGNYEYWHCETCNKYFKDEDATDAYLGQSSTVINALKHKGTLVKVSFKLPTCTEDGNPTYEYCTACGYSTLAGGVIPEGYKATGHDFTGAYVCDAENGYHSWKCLNGCGNSGMVVGDEQVAYKYDGENTVGGVECTFADNYTKEEIDGVYYHSHKCVCGNSDKEECTPTTQVFAPDCEKDGYTLNTCSKCGNVWKTDIVKSEGHDWSNTPVSNNDGKTHAVKCSKCSAVSTTENCSGGNATCKDKAVCEKCGQSYGSTSGHTFTNDWTYMNDAACGVNGTEKNTCDVCKTEVIREKDGTALDHDMSTFGYEVPEKLAAILEAAGIVIVAPTCGTEGRSISYCKNEGCTYYTTTRTPKDTDGHKYGDWVADSAGNCETGIRYTKTCSACGDVISKTENTGLHTFKETYRRLPTCDKEGHVEVTCTVCGKVEDRYYDETKAEDEEYEYKDLAPLGHDVKAWTTVEGDCKKEGYKTGFCNRCEKTVTEKIEGLGDHSWKDVAGVVPTCENGGYSAHKKCAVCGITEGKEVYAAYGHSDTNGDGVCDDCKTSLNGADDSSKSCGCICHKDNFLMKIIYKILNFFWKIFKISKTCDCGNVHW